MDTETRMTKAKVLDLIESERAHLESVLAQVDDGRMAEPGVEGDWSVKDIIAHITWSEREMVGVLKARALVGSDLWELSNDGRNAVVFEENRDRPLDEVLEEARRVYRELLPLLQALSDEDLTEPGRFAEMPPGLPLWRLIAGNTYLHYRDHAATVRAWLEKANALPEAANHQPWSS